MTSDLFLSITLMLAMSLAVACSENNGTRTNDASDATRKDGGSPDRGQDSSDRKDGSIEDGSSSDMDDASPDARAPDTSIPDAEKDAVADAPVDLVILDTQPPDAPLVTDGGPQGAWAVQLGDPSTDDKGEGIAIDLMGNTYVTGSFEGTASFGTKLLKSQGGMDVFVAKIDSQGQVVWATSAGGTAVDSGSDLAVDAAGNVYLTGTFSGSATFGGTTLQSIGQSDLFVAKIDSGGSFLWATNAGNAGGYSVGDGIALAGSGQIIVTGRFEGTTSFGSTTLTSEGEWDVFVAKLDGAGQFLWAKAGGGTSLDLGNDVAVDAAGNTYVVGWITGRAVFGSFTLFDNSIFDYTHAFVAKLDPNGAFLWVSHSDKGSDVHGRGIGVDGSGNVIISGYYDGVADFGTTTLKSFGSWDVFVAKLDASGSFLWARTAGSTFSDVGYDVAVDSAGNAYVCGDFQGTATFGTVSVTAKAHDAFVAKIDDSGDFVWVTTAGGQYSIGQAFAVAVSTTEHVGTTGRFHKTVSFSGTILSSPGGYDAFAWRLP